MNRYTVIKRKKLPRKEGGGYHGYIVRLYMGNTLITKVECFYHKTALQLARDWDSAHLIAS